MPIVSRSQSDWKALAQNGPALFVEVRPPKAAKGSVETDGHSATVEKTGALIDTGAGCSCIDNAIAQRLGLIPRDRITVHTAGGVCHQWRYDVMLSIPTLKMSQELPVLGAPLASGGHLVLIGRDILALGTLVYSGWRGGFEFCI